MAKNRRGSWFSLIISSILQTLRLHSRAPSGTGPRNSSHQCILWKSLPIPPNHPHCHSQLSFPHLFLRSRTSEAQAKFHKGTLLQLLIRTVPVHNDATETTCQYQIGPRRHAMASLVIPAERTRCRTLPPPLHLALAIMWRWPCNGVPARDG